MKCARCRTALKRPGIYYAGQVFGPVCAEKVGYVPPPKPKAHKRKPKRSKDAVPEVERCEFTRDMFDEVERVD